MLPGGSGGSDSMQDAQQVVLADKPAIAEASLRLDPAVRDELLKQLSTLAAVYHKLPAAFVKVRRAAVHRAEDLEELRAAREAGGGDGDGALAGASSGTAPPPPDDAAPSGSTVSGAVGAGASGGVGDLLGGLDDIPVRAANAASAVWCGRGSRRKHVSSNHLAGGSFRMLCAVRCG